MIKDSFLFSQKVYWMLSVIYERSYSLLVKP